MEGELETTKQKSKENLQQALLMERERNTQMQWDMEELRRKSMEMELKLKSKQVIYLSTTLVYFNLYFSLILFNLYLSLNYCYSINDMWNDTRMKSHVQSQKKNVLFKRKMCCCRNWMLVKSSMKSC